MTILQRPSPAPKAMMLMIALTLIVSCATVKSVRGLPTEEDDSEIEEMQSTNHLRRELRRLHIFGRSLVDHFELLPSDSSEETDPSMTGHLDALSTSREIMPELTEEQITDIFDQRPFIKQDEGEKNYLYDDHIITAEEMKQKEIKKTKSQKSKKTKKPKSKNAKNKVKKKKQNQKEITGKPTESPTNSPSGKPSKFPTENPTSSPTISESPTTSIVPTEFPTYFPTLDFSGEIGDLINTTFHLTLVREYDSTESDEKNITSDDLAAVENATLTFLQDNIGGENKFTPQSLVIVDTASNTTNLGDDEFVTSLVFQINASFLVMPSFGTWIEEEEISFLGASGISETPQCSIENYCLCCLNGSINNNANSNTCRKLGCKPNRCRKKPPKIQTLPELPATSQYMTDHGIEQDLYGQNFTNVIRTYTALKPKRANSVLNATDTFELAYCSMLHEALWYLAITSKKSFDDDDQFDDDFFGDDFFDILTAALCEEYSKSNCQRFEDNFCDSDDLNSCNLLCENIRVTFVPSSSPTSS